MTFRLINRIFTSILLIIVFFSHDYACTILNLNSQKGKFLCNNEDWNDPNTRIWFRESQDNKFGCVFLGFSNYWAQGGMNEKGLCFDWVAYNPFTDSQNVIDPAKQTYEGNLSQKIIEECETVDEAISYYSIYNEEAFYYAKIMFNDEFGNSAIVGWKDGKVRVEKATKNYQVLGYGQNIIESIIKDDPELSIRYMAYLLDSAHQEGQYATKYSNIYDISNKKIYLFYERNFDEFIQFDFTYEIKNDKNYNISSLFSSISILHPTPESIVNPSTVKFKWKGKIENNYYFYCSTDSNFTNVNPVIVKSSNLPKQYYAYLNFFFIVVSLLCCLKIKFKKFNNKLFLLLLISLFISCVNKKNVTEPTLVGIQEISTTIEGLEPNTKYFWKIKAIPEKYKQHSSEIFIQSFLTSN